MNYDLIQVNTTCNSKEQAHRLAEEIILSKLAACVQISTITSHYEWNSKHFVEEEYLLQIKTLSHLFELLDDWVIKHHPYETPELIATPVINSSEKYRKWVEDQCQPHEDSSNGL